MAVFPRSARGDAAGGMCFVARGMHFANVSIATNARNARTGALSKY
jgi:hypothetical protein